MTIRGIRNPMPSKGKKVSTIFDAPSTVKKHHNAARKAALGGGGETAGKPTSGKGQSLRHQAPPKTARSGPNCGKKVRMS